MRSKGNLYGCFEFVVFSTCALMEVEGLSAMWPDLKLYTMEDMVIAVVRPSGHRLPQSILVYKTKQNKIKRKTTTRQKFPSKISIWQRKEETNVDMLGDYNCKRWLEGKTWRRWRAWHGWGDMMTGHKGFWAWAWHAFVWRVCHGGIWLYERMGFGWPWILPHVHGNKGVGWTHTCLDINSHACLNGSGHHGSKLVRIHWIN